MMAENRIVIPTQKLELGEEPKHSDHFLGAHHYLGEVRNTPRLVLRYGNHEAATLLRALAASGCCLVVFLAWPKAFLISLDTAAR